MIVVGIKAINNDVLELELQPLHQQEKDMGLMDMAMSGNANGLLNAISQSRVPNHKVYMDRKWCAKNSVLPFGHVKLEVKLGEISKHRKGTKYYE